MVQSLTSVRANRANTILCEFLCAPHWPHLISSDQERGSAPPPSNTVYERQLLQKRHGFPLWIPQPNGHLPKSYVDKGVSVGDVGIITPEGAFDYLFNICLPAEHPNNAGLLPEGFVPLLTQHKDISEFPEHTSDSYLSSPSFQKLSGLLFQGTGSEGALLTMPQGALHEDIRNLTKFREYAALHAHSWYKFANGVCGREIENGELHLVTGCDKASSWGIATFSGDQTMAEEPVQLEFVAEDTPNGCVCFWQHSGNVDVKACPSPFDHSAQQGHMRNQCTFIRSHTISLSEGEWIKLMNSITVMSPGEGSDTSSIDRTSNISSRSKSTLKRLFSSFSALYPPPSRLL
ncbi:hypothetical protein FA15DRAFT_601623 [Coprinopsis marcescibilis]|uniref:Uncharacterized protein n=1 Tax=Coprinopsis marcescibilis TaxID=230819 RepID=A0A5C3KGV8_COPMA|nr:hypothetical protein FA15DRAFT_601623 [Coprinopsis marcescibilis]